MSDRLSLAIKRLLWPGIDYGLRSRYTLRHRLLHGAEITTLDIGCGTGCMTIAAAERGESALGISLDPDLHSAAETYRAAIGMDAERCRFQSASIYDLEDGDFPKFDQIILFETLEHLYHDELAIALCARHLKPDGWLHVTVPNRADHRFFPGLSRSEDGAHVRHGYDVAKLEALLCRHGLEVIDHQGVGRLGSVLGFLVVSRALALPGKLGRIAGFTAFALMWPLVQLLEVLPTESWSLYMLAAKREQRPVDASRLG